MVAMPNLEVHMDKECINCHKMGATDCGQCLECLAKEFGKNMTIGFLTIQKAKAELCAMLDEYHHEIDKAYVKADGELVVDLKVKMKGTRMAGEVEMVVSIGFIESRIKHAVKLVINEVQMGIPGVK